MANRTDTHARRRKSSYHPLYFMWRNMRTCCGVVGGRRANDAKCYAGITVCQEWRNDYHAFKAWALASGWRAGLCLIRHDKGMGFSPGNCTFGTRAQLRSTYRDVHRFNGTTLKDILGFGAENPNYRLALNRITHWGWDVNAACTVPACRCGSNFGGKYRARTGGVPA